MKKGKLYIGTSGWHYKHWTGTFYPEDTKEKDQFEVYAKSFKTVEINNSFYQLPSIKTFNNWRKKSPADFIFSVKASRYFTHMKKLIRDDDALDKFLRHAEKLEDKLGPILFQLPPRWKVNTERLQSFVSALPKEHLYTFEFRNKTWHNEGVYQVLEKYKCAFCIFELDRFVSPLKETADFVYVRLHGPEGKYQGSYSSATLKKWKERCLQWKKNKKDVYVYFDNDEKGYAAFNAQQLLQLVHGKQGQRS
jgi:uncharacterized protein YecE (DUF72 family)